MPRRYYRRRRIVNKDKYSIEQTSINTPQAVDWTEVAGVEGVTVASQQYTIPIVPATSVQGMRKVKHLDFTIGNLGSDTGSILYYAIVYTPSSYTPNNIDIPVTGTALPLYEPNQYVMSCGVLDFSAGPCRIRSPLARNLNSGDSINLILACTGDAASVSYYAVCRYAITLQ